ncbi:type I methionyl aminopeptidase [bacterium]|nr:type I methionyl aminopeptidase [bacterium]
MIPIKTKEEIAKLRKSAQLLVKAFRAVESALGPGVTTEMLDRIAEDTIRSSHGEPAFKGYKGYPKTICSSIESQVVHGIPGERVLKEGEIVSIDIGVKLEGYYSDAAKTYGIGLLSSDRTLLMKTTCQALHEGIHQCIEGNHLSDISHAIQDCVEKKGFSVVRALVGHGIGKALHEEPQIPNFGPPRTGPRLCAGMVFAIEPMINMGSPEVSFLDDGWTVETVDGCPSAHFEHTVLITKGEPEVFTLGIEENGDYWSKNGERTSH